MSKQLFEDVPMFDVELPEPAPEPLKLGDRVAYDTHLTRTDSRDRKGPNRVWTTEAYPGHQNPGGEGVVIGKRTLSHGHSERDEFGWSYSATEHFTAYLIAHSLYRTPVLVLPENIKATP